MDKAIVNVETLQAMANTIRDFTEEKGSLKPSEFNTKIENEIKKQSDVITEALEDAGIPVTGDESLSELIVKATDNIAEPANIYRVKTLAERDALTAKNGDLCIVENWSETTDIPFTGTIYTSKVYPQYDLPADFSTDKMPSYCGVSFGEYYDSSTYTMERIYAYWSGNGFSLSTGYESDDYEKSSSPNLEYTISNGKVVISNYMDWSWGSSPVFPKYYVYEGKFYKDQAHTNEVSSISYTYPVPLPVSAAENRFQDLEDRCSEEGKDAEYVKAIMSSFWAIVSGSTIGIYEYDGNNWNNYKIANGLATGSQVIPGFTALTNDGFQNGSFGQSGTKEEALQISNLCQGMTFGSAEDEPSTYFYSRYFQKYDGEYLPCLTGAKMLARSADSNGYMNLGELFGNCPNLKYIDMSTVTMRDGLKYSFQEVILNSPNVERFIAPTCVSNGASNGFKAGNSGATSQLRVLDLSRITVNGSYTMQYMCDGCANLETIIFPMTVIRNPGSEENLWTTAAFKGCSKLRNLDLSWLYCDKGGTFSVGVNLNDLCNGCSSLETLDLRNFTNHMASSGFVSYINCARMCKDCIKLKYVDIRSIEFIATDRYNHKSTFADAFLNVPADCLIIVKDDVTRQGILAASGCSHLTNIKTVAEYEG